MRRDLCGGGVGVNGQFRRFYKLEGWIWVVGLAVAAGMDPNSDRHFTIFLPDLLFGIESPGFGLGHSISYLFRGDLQQSIQTHYLGPLAVLIILHRIQQLFFRQPSAPGSNRNLNEAGGQF